MIKWVNIGESQFLNLTCNVGVYTFRIEYNTKDSGYYHLIQESSGQIVFLHYTDKERLIYQANREIKLWLQQKRQEFRENIERVLLEDKNLEAAIKELM